MHVDRLATHAISTAAQFRVVTRVLHFGKTSDQLALINRFATHHMQDHAEIFIRITQAIDRGHRTHDDRVLTLEQRLRGGQTHLLDVLVDRAVLLDERIARRHIRFRLIVIVITHEVLDSIVREKRLELPIQLRRERLVRRHHNRGLLNFLDDVGDGVCFAGACHTQQRLMRDARLEVRGELLDRLRLITGRFVMRFEDKRLGFLSSHAEGYGGKNPFYSPPIQSPSTVQVRRQ